MTDRMTPDGRREHLLTVALQQAGLTGWQTLTHAAVASAAGVSHALVVHRLGGIDTLRRAVMRRAVAERVVQVVAEGLAVRHPEAMAADASLKAEVAAWVAK